MVLSPKEPNVSAAAVSDALLEGAHDDHTKSERPTSKSKAMPGWLALWWREALAGLVLAASMAASILALYPYQGKPLSEWPYLISIGALLSVYAVLLRLASSFLITQGLALLKWRWFDRPGGRPITHLGLHDDAVRGPLGALTFVWTFHHPATWQWLGCTLILLILLTGPFFQQVLHFRTCSVIDHTNIQATIPQARIMYGKNYGPFNGQSLTASERAALTNGINALHGVSATCPSGNCTFEPYSSAGLCSTCRDLSSEVLISENNTSVQRCMAPSPGSSTGQNCYPAWTNKTLTYGPALNLSYFRDTVSDGHYKTYAVLGIGLDRRSMDVLIGLTGEDPKSSTRLPSAKCADADLNTTWLCRGYGYASCDFKPCVRTYEAQIVNGDFQERVTGTTFFDVLRNAGSAGYWFDAATVFALMNLTCISETEKDKLREWNYQIDDSDMWLNYDMIGGKVKFANTSEAPQFEQELVNRGCLYAANRNLYFDLESHMVRNYQNNTLTSVDGDVSYIQGTPLLQAIFNYGDFSFERIRSILDNMTQSLTNELRMNPGINDTAVDLTGHKYNITAAKAPVIGRMYTTTTCIEVQWIWLTLPIVVTVLTIVFFVGVLFSCRHLPADIKTWKTSSLPYIFFGPYTSDVGVRSPVASATQSDRELKAVGSRTKTRLLVEKDGFSVFTYKVD